MAEETKLATQNQEFGSALVDAARKKYDKERRDAVLGVVSEQIKLIDEAREAMALLTAQLAHYEAALKAVENGEFIFTPKGKLQMSNQDVSLGRWNPPGSYNYGG